MMRERCRVRNHVNKYTHHIEHPPRPDIYTLLSFHKHTLNANPYRQQNLFSTLKRVTQITIFTVEYMHHSSRDTSLKFLAKLSTGSPKCLLLVLDAIQRQL